MDRVECSIRDIRYVMVIKTYDEDDLREARLTGVEPPPRWEFRYSFTDDEGRILGLDCVLPHSLTYSDIAKGTVFCYACLNCKRDIFYWQDIPVHLAETEEQRGYRT